MALVRPRRSCVSLIALVVGACRQHEPKSMPAPPPDIRPQPVASSQGPQPSSRIPPDTLAGMVVDALTGQPLSRAQVVVLYETSALTDSSGRFRVGLPRKPATIQVRHEGYFDANTAAMYRPDSGQVAVFALTRDDARCRMATAGGGLPGVVVIVHDAVSTQLPNGLVSVIVQHGERRDSVPDCPWQVAPATFHAWLLPQ